VLLHLVLAREHRAGQHRVRRTRRQLARWGPYRLLGLPDRL